MLQKIILDYQPVTVKISPEVTSQYQIFYLKALKEIKEKSFYEMTTHRFLVVAQKA